MDRCFRREFDFAVVVGVKPLTQKYTFTRHGTKKAADRECNAHLNPKGLWNPAERRRLHMRQYYRVNVYLKVPV